MNTDTNPYESDKLLAEYLLFHFGQQEEVLPWAFGPQAALSFPVRTVAHFSEGKVASALDLGCAVGRSSFELSKSAEQVVGIDFSNSFVEAASKLNKGESITYEVAEEATLTRTLHANASDRGDGEVHFEQGDATNLRTDLGSFDRVHAANLLCRLPNPNLLLQRLPELVKPGGELVLATPCTWLEEYTAKEFFPKQSTLEWLQDSLSAHFDLANQADEPFLIREHARKYQWTVSMLTRWVRK